MISNTKLKSRIAKKNSPEIIEVLSIGLNQRPWEKVIKKLSSSRKKYSSINLKKINEESSEGDTIIVPGKVLGSGDLDKKVKICAASFSESALSKIKAAKSEAVSISEEIKSNPKATGLKVLR